MGVTQAIMDAYFNGDISAEKAKELLAPPPVAPKVDRAAHVERRAGQRWRGEYKDASSRLYPRVIEGTLVSLVGGVPGRYWVLRDVTTDGKPGGDNHTCFYDECFGDSGAYRMTLIADAPVQPNTPFVDPRPGCIGLCDSTAACDCKDAQPNTLVSAIDAKYGSRCAKHNAVASLCIQCKALTQSAQEAPRGLVCETRGQEIECGGPVLQRIVIHDLPPAEMCDAHWLLRESRISDGPDVPCAQPAGLKPRAKMAFQCFEDDFAGDV